MSTVPEVIVARHAGLKVLGISCITDECIPDRLSSLDLSYMIRVAKEAEPRMTRLVKRVVEKI
jgi:purine-nucleoside phosphorylase